MEQTKRIKILGKWMADRGYDAWNIFIGTEKWTQLVAVTKHPIRAMLKLYPFANINWKNVRAVKLT